MTERTMLTVVVGSVNSVTTGFHERVQQLERLLLVHRSHKIFPGFADGHATQEVRGDPERRSQNRAESTVALTTDIPDAGFRRQDPPSLKRTLRPRLGCKYV